MKSNIYLNQPEIQDAIQEYIRRKTGASVLGVTIRSDGRNLTGIGADVEVKHNHPTTEPGK